MPFILVIVIVAVSGDVSKPLVTGKYPTLNGCPLARKQIQPQGYPLLAKPPEVTAWCLPAGQ